MLFAPVVGVPVGFALVDPEDVERQGGRPAALRLSACLGIFVGNLDRLRAEAGRRYLRVERRGAVAVHDEYAEMLKPGKLLLLRAVGGSAPKRERAAHGCDD